MTLGFSTQINGEPNLFPEKIWAGLVDNGIELPEFWPGWYQLNTIYDFNGNLFDSLVAKLHTIRADQYNRWRPVMDIHPVINNRTKNRFQFAPTLKCKSVQKIEIIHDAHGHQLVFIDDELFYDSLLKLSDKMKDLAINDGFDSVADFFNYFNENFTGKIIHWTDLKY